MLSSSTEDSDSGNSLPLGFDPQEFRKKREEKLKMAKSVLIKKKEVEHVQNLPDELTYNNLLKRAMHILKSNDNTQAKMKLPLEVKREFGNKTMINLVEIAKILNRDPDHIKKYLFSELATSGSVNIEGKLLMKGNFLKAQIQDVLRLYIEHFIVCASCDAVLNTNIVRENKLYFLRCKNCGASRYVGNIVEGFKSKGKVRPKLRGLI
ncbi:hypothetical protein VCUG_00652 [Vavraia culicis subsp. floridensis]|uniref:Translation initiation factor IF2/IF5 domain-containing protein n=1 Tax=Vavraia culicis (isolate floridensis) TaxID=948595 RepID=L2GXH7_VAVCU|nr:uncharacterized protein VCUG_00652 [Vavraia culicis subsp. floridensis]ELA47810.1 hypothetical protein VCUG_00652 [Vavraia culicis subsp. floridensis]